MDFYSGNRSSTINQKERINSQADSQNLHFVENDNDKSGQKSLKLKNVLQPSLRLWTDKSIVTYFML
jgi:hypothetical protein